MAFQKILIAVDDDPIAVHAADVGAEMAAALGAEVALIHVVNPSLIFAPEPGLPADELSRHAERNGSRLMADFRARLPAALPAVQFIAHGPPGEEIVRAAKEWPADLVVLGSHGRKGITRALAGSVAEAVMRHAPCPVLVVRAKG